MATVYKNFLSSDVVNTRTLLHESIPITGSIVSGTYGGNAVNIGSEPHIKTYSHGMFESVYDYPYLSSSANHIFDVAVGYSGKSSLSSSTNSQNAKKINIYNQMAQVLYGYDHTGGIREFDEDGDLSGGAKLRECIFFNFSRLLYKDEIKKGTFNLHLGTGGHATSASAAEGYSELIKIYDASGSNQYFVNSPVGEYGILYATGSDDANWGSIETGSEESKFDVAIKGGRGARVGLLFYQAGIAVISASCLLPEISGGILDNSLHDSLPPHASAHGPHLGGMTGYAAQLYDNITAVLTGSTITAASDLIRHRVADISFSNTTELNSAIHFCRVNHNEYNYSANPTYLTGSKIRVKGNNRKNLPVSYVTQIGLYSADRELLAVAKLSEPIKKDPTTETTFKVRLDY